MKLTYDPRHNVAYLRLREPRTDVESIRVSDELTVDLAPDGTVYGIELLNANVQLRAADGGRLVVTDESSGREDTVPLGTGTRGCSPATPLSFRGRAPLSTGIVASSPGPAEVSAGPVSIQGRRRRRRCRSSPFETSAPRA